MMMDIFSSFDPGFYSFSGGVSVFLFFFISVMVLLFFFTNFWSGLSRFNIILLSLMNVMLEQSQRTIGGKIKGFSSMLSSLFLFIILINFFGLVPYMFSLSSHLIFSLSFGLVLWLSIIISSVVAFFFTFLAYLLPGGAPGWLNPFLVLVETVSILVRPITLSFRLAANMSAGHIVLTLMGVYASSLFFTSMMMFVLLVFVQLFFLIFEMGVCLIQSYIFCLLASLYSDDHPIS